MLMDNDILILNMNIPYRMDGKDKFYEITLWNVSKELFVEHWIRKTWDGIFMEILSDHSRQQPTELLDHSRSSACTY